jgi:exopolysaccharide biosynthesis polyprenyl glycosylphosphotransferase
MLKEKDYIFSRLNMLIDMGVATIAFIAAHLLRNHVLSPYIAPTILAPSKFSHYAWLLLVFPIITVIVLAFNNYYNSQRIRNPLQIIKILLISSGEVAVICISLIYMIYKKDVVSRGQMLVAPMLLFILLSLKTVLVKKFLTTLRKKGYNYRRLLFVGGGERLPEFIEMIEGHPFWGFRILGILTDNPEKFKKGDKIRDWNIVGKADDLITFVEKNPVDEVIFLPDRMTLADMEDLLEACEIMGIRTRLAINFFNPKFAMIGMEFFEKVPLITFDPAHNMNAALFIKYSFDRIAAAILLILFSPFMLCVALIIKLSSGKGAPVFFIQKRSGINGRLFNLYKFRSMKVGAEKDLEILKSQSDVDGPVFKMKNDPRITRFGRFIRKFSIDELPQIFNVLKGEMSLVGPRPPLPDEVMKYDRWQRRRLSMKPGITCLWQVMGRNKISFEAWMKLDLQYIDNWSLWLDLKILFKTIFVVIAGYGAS